MKVEVKEPKKFNPITITIETEAEYYWVLACLNTSYVSAHKSAEQIGFSLGDSYEVSVLAYEMFAKVLAIHQKQGEK